MTSEQPALTVPALTVIVVSYNTRALTVAALRTLYETTKDTALHVVVLDNASSDGSADAVAEAFPQVELIRSEENLGFSRANNVVAAAAKTEWLLLLNPDTECHAGAVDNLMRFARQTPQAGIWGGRTVFPDGSLNIASCWMRITPWSAFCRAVWLDKIFARSELFNFEAMGAWPRDTVRQVDIVVGCFLLIRKPLWDELGGFDLKYFMYGEEADLCLRAARLGYAPMITPEAQIMHIVGAASKTQGSKVALVAKARATLIRDHWAPWMVPLGLGCMWLGAALRHAAAAGPALVLRRGAWAERAERSAVVWRSRRDWLGGY